MPSVSAVVLSYNRRRSLTRTLERLAELPVDEVLVADNASSDGTLEMLRERDDIRLVDNGANLGASGRNEAVRRATGDLVVSLDDDSCPLPGAIEEMVAAFEHNPRLGALGGFVRDVDNEGDVVISTEVGTFDWFLRCGRKGAPPPDGFETFFFPEGACMVRRDAFLEVGGFYPPYFFETSEIDLTARLVAAGWEVRYLPTAPFDHYKSLEGREAVGGRKGAGLRLRIRNQIWYFALRFPATVALRRIPAYLAFDLVEASYRGLFRDAWLGGIADAVRLRHEVRADRHPLPRAALRKAEVNRGRMHLRLLGHMVRRAGARARAALPRAS